VRGGGKGGQKINKTANCVQLNYPPLGLSVRCQKDRQRSLNRFLALRELVDRIEVEISPGTSERLREIEKIRKRKSKKAGRSKEKYGSPNTQRPSGSPGGEEAPMPAPSNPKIDIRKITKEHAKELGIPDTPQTTGDWMPWECEAKTFECEYTCTETAYFYQGRVKVKTPQEEVEIRAGDLVCFPEGLKCTWQVLEPVRKVYSFEEA
jgi:uncharacterized cupin superfamily protein